MSLHDPSTRQGKGRTSSSPRQVGIQVAVSLPPPLARTGYAWPFVSNGGGLGLWGMLHDSSGERVPEEEQSLPCLKFLLKTC